MTNIKIKKLLLKKKKKKIVSLTAYLKNINKIINNVKGINRVVYDITSKPPSTIELE